MINLKTCFSLILSTTKFQMCEFIRAKLLEEGNSIKFKYAESFADTSENAKFIKPMKGIEMRIIPKIIYLGRFNEIRIKYTYYSKNVKEEEFDNNINAFDINELEYIAELLED